MLVPFSSHFCPDPKTLRVGSAFSAPGRSGSETQDMVFHQLRFLQYVVFHPCPVTRPAVGIKAALLIPSPWYTSGNP